MVKKWLFKLEQLPLIVSLILISIFSLFFIACGSSTEATTNTTKKEEVVAEKEEVNEEAIVEETECVEEEVVEETTEEAPKEEGPQNVVEWAELVYKGEPKLTAWNDETGTKEVIDAGGSYVMKQGDTLAIYHSRDAWVENIEPYDFVEALGPGLYTRIEYIQPDKSQTINMKGGEWKDEWSGELEDAYVSGKRETYNFTITTP